MSKAKVLIIDDEPHMQELLSINLSAENFEVAVSNCGESGYLKTISFQPDLIVLDVMMPNMCGITLCKKLRSEKIMTPILFLSAKGRAEDRVEGLKAGGDDYLQKPFNLKELLLRVRKLTKPFKTKNECVEFGKCWINFDSYQAFGVKGEFTLDKKEWIIMKYFTSNPEQIITKEQLLKHVWEYYNEVPNTRTVDTFIYNLRQHFCENPNKPVHIKLIKGNGYLFSFQ
ncbi:MAG: response regulator transcription factor [Bacteroidia bacterium]|nr:response regulator transcription factor [Bacteroidia bacterium]